MPVRACLARSGCFAALGRYRHDRVEPIAFGERVVVEGPWGPRLGIFLADMGAQDSESPEACAGRLVRLATDADLQADASARDRARRLLQLASDAIEALGAPFLALDAECALDASRVVVHVLPLASEPTTRVSAWIAAHGEGCVDVDIDVHVWQGDEPGAWIDFAPGEARAAGGGCGSCGCGSSGKTGCCATASRTAAEPARSAALANGTRVSLYDGG